MAKQISSPANSQCLDNIVEINEELQALLIPLLTAVENEAETDTHLMLRAVQRIVISQSDELIQLKTNLTI